MNQASSSSRVMPVVLLIFLLLLHQQQADAANTTNKADTPTEPKPDKSVPTTSPQLEHSAQPVSNSQQKQAAKTTPAAKQHDEIPKQSTKASDAGRAPNAAKAPVGDADPSTGFNDSFPPIFYLLVGITTSVILLLVARVYRLRLSRAERKYGVQGDRANQELTPLPMAIEDVNTDEDEDHTLFDVNRHSIRIL